MKDIEEATNEVSQKVIGAAIEVHRNLGPGFLEHVYEQAMVIELFARKMNVKRQVPVPITYKSSVIGESRIDILINDCLILELKAVDGFSPVHIAQVLSYLRATRLQLGLLINFNVPVLREGIKRIVLT